MTNTFDNGGWVLPVVPEPHYGDEVIVLARLSDGTLATLSKQHGLWFAVGCIDSERWDEWVDILGVISWKIIASGHEEVI